MSDYKIKMKRKNAQGVVEVLFPYTIIPQVQGLQTELDIRLLKNFENYDSANSLADNDLLIIWDSTNNVNKSITGSAIKNSHFKGYYATPAALSTAWPAANCVNGDYAVVGTTDTVWIWDSDTNAWVDSNKVASAGTLNTTATTAQTPSASESFAGNITLHKISKTGSYDDLLNKPTLPTGNSNIHYSATEPASWTITDLWCELGDVVLPQT